MNAESSCYSKIIDCYLENRNKENIDKELFKSRSIIKIIKQSQCRNDLNFIKNALILILSLYDDHPADVYSNFGNDIKQCNQLEKKIILSRLKKEII
ncbi:MAG: hypothetical protein ACFFBP_04585 [Promethearchaeota archaeon]